MTAPVERAEFEPTWEGWRTVARILLSRGVPPERIHWMPRRQEAPELGLFADTGGRNQEVGTTPVRVSRGVLELAEAVACHRDPSRWPLLYRTFWRLTRGESDLLEREIDPDVRSLAVMERAVRRAAHKMKAFVRFRATGGEDDPFMAWFEPEHHVVERVAPFFARRFSGMRWSILTPERCAHWDGRALSFTAGATAGDAPGEDRLERLWRTYYAHIFNPARLNERAMRAEMPKKYWKNLPEAELIDPLRTAAPDRVSSMLERRSRPEEEPALRRKRE